jgi:hypothetical protein
VTSIKFELRLPYISDHIPQYAFPVHSMSTAIPPPLALPGDGKSRKGSKSRPRLPLSVFTSSPNAGTSESFPLPSPSTLHPTAVIDANVLASDGDVSLTQWKKEAGQVLGGRVGGVVLSLPGANLEQAIDRRVSSMFGRTR